MCIPKDTSSGTPGIIADSPCKAITYSGNSTGTRKAETDYHYAGTSSLCSTISSVAAVGGASGFTGRDDTTFGQRDCRCQAAVRLLGATWTV
jgi:hypothetical protein